MWAARFDASTEQFTATTGLPAGTIWTAACWARPATVGTRFRHVFTLNNNDFSQGAGIQIRDTGPDLQAFDYTTYGANGVGPIIATVDTWYGLALVVRGSTATYYRRTAGGALIAKTVTDFTPPTTPARLYIGDDEFDSWWDGRIAPFKMWQAALLPGEIEAELAQYVPVRKRDLLRFHPFATAVGTDFGPRRLDLSGGTGTTTEDGPPIIWERAVIPQTVKPAAAAGNTVTLTLGQAAEADTAQPLSRSKSRTLGQAAEADTGGVLTRTKTRTILQAFEVDSAFTLTRTKARTLGQAAELDSAHPVTIVGAVPPHQLPLTLTSIPVGNTLTAIPARRTLTALED